ncbi:MAG: hypothetical protein IID46_11950 [Planctomycetes bacterium]|nr:hypothetical protein [Planctomycetota bacterium]
MPVPRQDRLLCAQQVFTKLLAGIQARRLAFPVDVKLSRTIQSAALIERFPFG